ncbi:diguanylate cyclase (GGDEF) domain-containing protein [Desulfatibacillum alkenivorans DSM 16219]|jgi:diguanylate cyclase (GGDEF)-like protein|uniref:Diguanylate cyclase (GGDEF) domain-containing protein n=1 Tax=Desulfatibacillum alkenivorans DSM 16219 TaxID=1121393 RepID=A0A1M6PRV6_9BACT|nr:bifunctional diguanylate cyclase/phosphodiesterase [Desulfatibacillum alkenivorans]SHK10680.1 diguanylate cyclase (GGDEF) domain-containing protein [Desulfatibacillum alkenivorans DSM 16219]
MFQALTTWEQEILDFKQVSDNLKVYETGCYQSLVDIIENQSIETVFQPIVDLHKGDVFAYEALSRIKGESSFPNTESLFQASQFFQKTLQLERVCQRSAMKKAEDLGLTRPVCINLCPSVFRTPECRHGDVTCMLDELFGIRDKIIIELTERFCIRDDELFKRTIDSYRQQGFRIAIDDLGSGYAGLKMLAQIEPFIVKMDRFLIAGIDKSTKKQMLLSAFVSFCHKINALVVAEGIETKEELETVAALKVDLGQGYFLARPNKKPVSCSSEAKSEILRINQPAVNGLEVGNFIGSLAKYIAPVNNDHKVEGILKRFDLEKDLSSVPVVKDNRPVGIIHKTKIFYKLGHKYGYDLFARKNVENIMETGMIFEASTPLDDVARTIITRDSTSVYDALIIVLNGSYMGVVQIHDLLEAITQQKINMAKQANPLTGLPGNNLIKTEIADRLNAKNIFAVMYFDLDDFKPFNDNFGFDQGDQVIRLVGNILRDMTQEWDPLGFVGHIGGDDFVVICRAGGIERFCEAVLHRFTVESRKFYPEEVLEKGSYTSKDRKGEQRDFPLLSLSIAIITTQNRVIESYGRLASLASEVKKKAKTIQGNSYYIDQRRQ